MMNTVLHSGSTIQPAVRAATIEVHLAHSCPIVRAGLAAVLAAQADFRISAAPDGAPGDGTPCVVIADYASGVGAARAAWPQGAGHARRWLVLASHDREWEVRQALDCGVHGFMLLGCEVSELVRAVRMLGGGGRYLSESASRSVAESLSRAPLTPREADVLRVLARGSSDKLIARELGITVGTVKTHMKQLLLKLGASTRTQTVVLAMKRGLLADQHDAPAPTPMLQ